MRLLIINFFLVLTLTFQVETTQVHPDINTITRRAAIDVGSGSIKVAIADVETKTNKIAQTYFQGSYPVAFQASLENSIDGYFDDQTMQEALDVFEQIHLLAESCQVDQIQAIATEAFRVSGNGSYLAMLITEHTGIPFKIITQREEGVIAFDSAVSVSDYAAKDLVVWDIGTGSFQISTLNERNNLVIHMGHYGSIPFRNYIIDIIQDKDIDLFESPNPLTEEDLKKADRFARSLARTAYPIIKERIKDESTTIVGIGRLFGSSIAPCGYEGHITRKHLRKFIDSSLNQTDAQLNNPYAHVDVSNAILVLGFMKALHIQEIEVLETTSAKGLLTSKEYWK